MFFKNIKKKWNITSNFQLVVIFIVFGITGSMSVKLAKPILDLFKIHPEVFDTVSGGNFIYWTLRILIVFPAYQLLLIVIGTLFFQFRFFWEFEKKILKRLGFQWLFREKK